MKFIFFIALVFAKLSIADNFLSNGGPFGTPTSDNKNTLRKKLYKFSILSRW